MPRYETIERGIIAASITTGDLPCVLSNRPTGCSNGYVTCPHVSRNRWPRCLPARFTPVVH